MWRRPIVSLFCFVVADLFVRFIAPGHRLRKISGNYNSESSSLSAREVRYCRADEACNATAGGREERIVLVTPERKVPFAVMSVIPFSKGNRLQNR